MNEKESPDNELFIDKAKRLRAAGFTEDEIAMEGELFAQETRDRLSAAKFTPSEIEDEIRRQFGRGKVEDNFFDKLIKDPSEEIQTIFKTAKEGFDYGVLTSSSGMITQAMERRDITPEYIPSQSYPMFKEIAAGAGTLFGDAPAMAAGAVVGAGVTMAAVASAPITLTAGAAALIVGAGGTAGAFALPTGIRESLLQFYDKTKAKTFGEYWGRMTEVTTKTAESAFVGAASSVVGAGVGAAAAKTAMAAKASEKVITASQKTAGLTAEVATMVELGARLEGEAPQADDFMKAAAVIGLAAFGVKTVSKLQQIYAKTGMRPEQVAEMAQTNPKIKEELASNSNTVPSITGDEVLVAPNGKAKVLEEVSPKTEQIKLETPKAEDVSPVADPVLASAKEKIFNLIERDVAIRDLAKNYTKEDFVFQWVDRIFPIKKISKDAYLLSALSTGWAGKAELMLEVGGDALGYKGKPYKKILEPFKTAKEQNEYREYLIAAKSKELISQGLDAPLPLAEANAVLKNGKKKYEKAAQELYEFNNFGLETLSGSGLISKETKNYLIEKWKNPVRFEVVKDPQTGVKPKNASSTVKALGKNVERSAPEYRIYDPLIVAPNRQMGIFKAADKNLALQPLVKEYDAAMKASKNDPESFPFFREVKKTQKTELKAEEIFEALEKNLNLTVDELAALPPDQLVGQIFRGKKEPLNKDTQFEVYQDGVRRVFETTDKNLLLAIQTMQGVPVPQNMFMKTMQILTTAKRTGITISVPFQISNMIRDQFAQKIISKHGAVPFTEFLAGLRSYFTKDEHYRAFLAEGGKSGSFLRPEQLADTLRLLDNVETSGVTQKSFRNVVENPVELWAHIQEAARSTSKKIATPIKKGFNAWADIQQGIEMAPRLTVFKRAREAGMLPKEAAYEGRRATLDFSKSGYYGAIANTYAAFFNARVQGLDRTLEAFKENPKAAAAYSLGYITSLSALTYYLGADDPDIQELPSFRKAGFWNFKIDNWREEKFPGEADAFGVRDHNRRLNKNGALEINVGPIISLPKPQEIGVLFGSLFEIMLDGLRGKNPEAFETLMQALVSQAIPIPFPDGGVAIAEQVNNRNYFLESDLVPGSTMQNALPEEKYTPYTTETAKAIAGIIGHFPGLREAQRMAGIEQTLDAPIIFQNYVRSFLGSTGESALRLSDYLGKKLGVFDKTNDIAWTTSDIPFFGSFVARYPSLNSKSIQEFDKLREENMQYINSFELRKNRLEPEKASELVRNYGEYFAGLAGLNDAKQNIISNMNKIKLLKEWTPEQKRQAIDKLTLDLIEACQLGVEAIRQVRELEKDKQSPIYNLKGEK